MGADEQKSLLQAISRLEYRLAEMQGEARACRTAINELELADVILRGQSAQAAVDSIIAAHVARQKS